MQESLNIPWNRYALIADLAERLDGVSPQLGKTALQKLIYLLQELFRIDCGYNFEFYSYGTFTSQLLQDLDLIENMGAVAINPVASFPGGYEIKPGPGKETLKSKAAGFLDSRDVRSALEKLVNDFGKDCAKDLELSSTIIFVDRDLKRQRGETKGDDLVLLVKELKPKFSEDEIEKDLRRLESKGYLELGRC